MQRLTDGFVPTSAEEQAVGELRRLHHGKLSIERYSEKYYTLVRKRHTADPELLYWCFKARLSPGELQSLTVWGA